MNTYFIDNPERVLGEPVIGNGMYGSGTLTVRNEDLRSVPEQLHTQLQDIAQAAVSAGRGVAERQGEQAVESAAVVPTGSDLQVGHITASLDGTFTQVTPEGANESLKVPMTQQAELRALLSLRDVGRSVLTLEADNVEDTIELEAARQGLRDTYSAYVDSYGPINRFTERRTGRFTDAGEDIMARMTPKAMRLLRKDPFGALVTALENFDEATQKASPAAL